LALAPLPSITTPVLTTTTASNGSVIPFLFIPAAVLGTEAPEVVAALGGAVGDGVGLIGGKFWIRP
jgi:hypothetical protein